MRVDVAEPVQRVPPVESAPHVDIELPAIEVIAPGPPLFVRASAALKTGAIAGLEVAVETLERAGRMAPGVVAWLMRGAAALSTASVVLLGVMNRDQVVARWGQVVAVVMAAAQRPAPAAPPPASPSSGNGRLTVAVTNSIAQVLIDGQARGPAPVTVDLPAGVHRVLLRSLKGQVERSVRVPAGQSVDISEDIFPGWLAVTTSIDVSLSESGQVLARDDRGWVMLPPGPHDIHLDNGGLGLHEVRHVFITPGDTTRLSLAPRASTLSLTTTQPAEVWIDGMPFGEAPLVDQPIALGAHDIRVRSASAERWVHVRATVQPVQVNVDLTAP